MGIKQVNAKLAKEGYCVEVTERDSYKAEPLVFNRWGGK